MEDLWGKLGAIIAAVITALGGYFVYDKKTTHERFNKIESDLAQSKIDIKVIETKFTELKSDTEEIKETQRSIIELLTAMPKRRGK